MKGGADASHRSVLSISPSAIVISPHQISIPSQQVRFHNICVTTNQENVETTANHTFFTSSFKISQCAYVRRRPCTENRAANSAPARPGQRKNSLRLCRSSEPILLDEGVYFCRSTRAVRVLHRFWSRPATTLNPM